MGWWSQQSARYKDLLAEYGAVALGVWLTIFVITLLGFWAAINAGFEFEGTAGTVGKFGAAYGATQLTKPLRIGLTVVLTPIVARLKHRMMGTEPEPAAPEAVPEGAESSE
ncbi:MAG: DUF1279 domain-containing protein [Myxococcota bacterium]